MIVVFHGHGSKWLSPGFRHVFFVIDDGEYQIRLDGQAGLPTVEVVAKGNFDIAEYYREQGYTVVVAEQKASPRWPLVSSTCVGMTKSFLGVRAPWIQTPKQLHRYLIRAAPTP